MIFIKLTSLLLISIRCTVYPEHKDGHSCTFGNSIRHFSLIIAMGTDIRFIQELLGHNDIKTTLRYTHVSTRDLGKIENPLDAMMRKQAEK